jgi:hypothetical protein
MICKCHTRNPLIILILVIFIGVLTWGAIIGIIFYWQPDPVSPPATTPGTNSDFDALLAKVSEEMLFLFRHEEKIILSDIYGHELGIILDVVDSTNNREAQLLSSQTVSPDNERLAVNYFIERDPNRWSQPVGKVLIVDIETGNVTDIPVSLEGFYFDSSYPVHWLDDQVILVKMHRSMGPPDYFEELRFLRYDIRNISSFQVIEFDPCSQTTVMDKDTSTLLIASDCDPHNDLKVWAIDSGGKRLATEDEILLFDNFIQNRYQPKNNYQHPSPSFPMIQLEYVAFGADGFGRFWEDNWGRQYMYLGDDLVRVSDSMIWYEPEWQSGLDLFIWDEGDNTYIMDNEGHYHHMYNGDYLGRIPRNRSQNSDL